MKTEPVKTDAGKQAEPTHTKRRSSKGKRRQRKKQPPRPPCGAQTRYCIHCGHRRNEHAAGKGRCFICGDKCEQFDPRPCKNTKTIARTGRCRMHNGNAASGIMAPGWKHGRIGSSLGNRALRDGFYSALSDRNLLNGRQDVALLDGTLTAFTRSLKEGKPLTSKDRREIIELTTARRLGIESMHRMEQQSGKNVPKDICLKFMLLCVESMQQEAIGPDGRPDYDLLRRVKARMEGGWKGLLGAVSEGEIIDAETDDDGKQ